MIYQGPNQEFLQLEEVRQGDSFLFDGDLTYPLLFIWITSDDAQVRVDHENIKVGRNTVLCLTIFDKIEFTELESARMIKFNKEFYCVLQHDHEVSCKGVLFFTSRQLQMFQIPDKEIPKFETLWKVFEMEMESKEDLQLDMLQMMLKRFIILSTRLYKNQNNYDQLDTQNVDIVRNFSFLVEKHFRHKHSVSDYAELLHKSPKTLSNIFSKLSGDSPLQIIHERIKLEARRLLLYSDQTIKEITYELGFEDIQSFSRFFKKMEGQSPSEFRKSLSGKIDKSTGKLTY